MIKYWFFWLSITVYVSSEIRLKGGCPAISSKANLSVPQFIGRWFPYLQLGLDLEDLKCIENTYAVTEKYWRVSSVTKAIKITTGEPVVVNGYAYNVTELEDASVWKTGVDGEDKTKEAFIMDIAWDYDKYSVAYWCRPDGEWKYVTLLVQLREKDPSSDTLNKINDVIRTVSLEGEALDKIDQEHC